MRQIEQKRIWKVPSSKEESSSIVAEELRFRKIAKVAKKMREVPPSRVFKMFREGISPMDVVEETNADPTLIRNWFRAWVEMNEDWRWWREREAKVVEERAVQLKTGEREARAKPLMKELEVEAKNKLGQLGSDEAIKLQGKKPSGLIAGMIYILAKERGLSDVVTQTQLADTYDITTQTVIKNVKLLKQLMQNPVIGKDIE